MREAPKTCDATGGLARGGLRESRTVLHHHERRRNAGLRSVPEHKNAAVLPTRLRQALQRRRNAIPDRPPDRRTLDEAHGVYAAGYRRIFAAREHQPRNHAVQARAHRTETDDSTTGAA